MTTKWKWDGSYPVRCIICDVEGEEVMPGVIAQTPTVSKPHIGKEGLAKLDKGIVKITLDDGCVLYGHECWWDALPPKEVKPA